MIEKKLAAVLEERFKQDDMADCYVVDVVSGKGQKVEVFMDSDSQLTLDKCRIISRYLEKQIEENGWLGEKYTLDVSSPGIDRPITLLRQYRKNQGRNIRIKTDETEVSGRLEEVDAKGIVVIEKKKKEEIRHEFEYDQIREAKIQVSFK